MTYWRSGWIIPAPAAVASWLLCIGRRPSVLFGGAKLVSKVDYRRFMPEKLPCPDRWQWWANFAGRAGWMLLGAAKIMAGSLLAYLAIGQGLSAVDAGDPPYVPSGVFYLTASPTLALVLAAIL